MTHIPNPQGTSEFMAYALQTITQSKPYQVLEAHDRAHGIEHGEMGISSCYLDYKMYLIEHLWQVLYQDDDSMNSLQVLQNDIDLAATCESLESVLEDVEKLLTDRLSALSQASDAIPSRTVQLSAAARLEGNLVDKLYGATLAQRLRLGRMNASFKKILRSPLLTQFSGRRKSK